MSNETEFLRQLRDALAHLYDYAYLQRHPLADRLIPPVVQAACIPTERVGKTGGPAQATATRTRAQELRLILLNAIEALNPGDNIPIRAAERQAYAILFGLYIEGRDRREMAASLNISGRQLRRDRAAAYEALASILQDRYLTLELPVPPPPEEPLRSESERLAQQKEPVDLSELIEGLIPLLHPLASQQDIHLISRLEPELPKPWVNRILIRQSLIGLASHAIASLPLAQLIFEAHQVEARVHLGLRLRYQRSALPAAGEIPPLEPLLKSVETLVSALNSQLCQEQVNPEEATIWLLLPEGVERLVLVVDDNEELFALFQRYVTGQPYRLIHAPSVDEALALLPSARPDMIILDLMLPNRDGWELLQILHSNPETAQIPVAVCSILDDPELAFSWGAQFYLRKPVGSLELLQALAEALR